MDLFESGVKESERFGDRGLVSLAESPQHP